MIETTDEMVQLIVDQLDFTDGSRAHEEVRRGLADVFVLIERDSMVIPRECKALCAGDPDTWCEAPRGHIGPHRAEVLREVTW